MVGVMNMDLSCLFRSLSWSNVSVHYVALHRMTLHGLSVHKWDVAFVIYVTAGVLIDVALLYCSMQGVDNLKLCQEVLQLRYLVEPVDCMNAILDGTAHWLLIKSVVKSWLAEYNLNQWVGAMNLKLGVAPSYEFVFNHYMSLCTHRRDFD